MTYLRWLGDSPSPLIQVFRIHFGGTRMNRICISLVTAMLGMWAGHVSAGDVTNAAASGQIETLRALLDGGAPVDEPGSATPLYFASQSGHVDAVRLLLERGADPNALANIGTPLMIAARRKKTEIAKLLLEHGADPNFAGGEDNRTPLHEAAYIGADDVVRLLLDHGADTDARTRFLEPPLHEAVKKGRETAAKILRAATNWAPPVPPTEADLAAVDLEAGRIEALTCTACHPMEPDKDPGKSVGGPKLWGVFGRRKAGLERYPYTDVMRAAEGTWDVAALDAFLSDPMMAIPGTSMDRVRIKNRDTRWALIAYLQTLR